MDIMKRVLWSRLVRDRNPVDDLRVGEVPAQSIDVGHSPFPKQPFQNARDEEDHDDTSFSFQVPHQLREDLHGRAVHDERRSLRDWYAEVLHAPPKFGR